MRTSPFLSSVLFCFIFVAHGEKIYETQEKSFNKTFFVSEIFQKYGNRDYMTYEGFEHLLENLGLGRLKFDINHDVSIHKVNGTFKEFHEELKLHKHNHEVGEANPDEHIIVKRNLREYYRGAGNKRRQKRCLTPEDLLATYGFETTHGVVISHNGFVDMCPAIVYELDSRSCWDEMTKIEVPELETEYHLVWLYASLSVFVMSVAGLLCILVVPVVAHGCYKSLLEFLMATGVGTLCGDALLHLLPHILVQRIEESKAQPILRGTFTLLSVFLFFIIEILLKYIRNQRILKSTVSDELGKMITIQGEKCDPGHQHLDISGRKNDAVASMIIIGDVLHNVTDGLSIGAAFTASIPSGFASTIAIISHELPHELGDYATLISSGMSRKKSLFYNLVSSVFSFFGMIIGILLGEVKHASLWINAFTAGSFLYIALSDLVPEMKLSIAGESKVKNVLIQISGLLCGGFIMLCVALFEDDLETLLN